MHRRVVPAFATVAALALALLTTSAPAAAPAMATQTTLAGQANASDPTEPASEGDTSAFDYARYRFEGIPQPWWDGAVDGWFTYLGNGHFISEYGVEFFWRDGRFVWADGSLMGLPPSAEEHLNSLGIYRQLTAEDLAGAEGTEPPADGGLTAASWPGTYLHVGRNTTTSVGFYATQADISVFNRSRECQRYQGIGLRNADNYRIGLQYCAQSPGNWSSCAWVPAIHGWIAGVPIEIPYDNHVIMTTPYHSETHNLKLAVKANG